MITKEIMNRLEIKVRLSSYLRHLPIFFFSRSIFEKMLRLQILTNLRGNWEFNQLDALRISESAESGIFSVREVEAIFVSAF